MKVVGNTSELVAATERTSDLKPPVEPSVGEEVLAFA
jgi:hypothetical protein